MKNRYIVITRDWKGQYCLNGVIGMRLVGGEEDVETGGDCFCMVFSEKETKWSAQEIYDIHNSLNEEDVEGFTYDPEDQDAVIEV